MKNLRVALFSILLLTSFVAWATAMVSVSGKVIQIKNGNVEIQSEGGLSKVILKKLPKDQQDAVMQAMSQHRILTLQVSPEMLAKK